MSAEPEVNTGFSRRSFVGGTAAAITTAALGGLVGCSQTKSNAKAQTSQSWDKEADVVIVGGGGTGLAAAVEAGRAGASVLILEKAALPGGSSKICGGIVMVAASHYQKDLKGYVGDTAEKCYQYFLAAGEGVVDEALVKDYVYAGVENLSWLEEQGVKYVNCYSVKPVPGVPLELTEPPRMHIPGDAKSGIHAASGSGHFHTDALEATLKSLTKVATEVETEVTGLIVNDAHEVIGVTAKNARGQFTVKANRGVIIATGGIDHNLEMAKALSPWHYRTLTAHDQMCFAVPTNTGDGIRMAQAIGAGLAGLGGTINTATNTSIGRDPGGDVGEPIPGIAVNVYGQRFCNEWSHYDYYWYKAYAQDTHDTWIIFDQAVYDLGAAALGVASGLGSTEGADALAAALTKGSLVKGQTLRELAGKLGINADGLEATLAKWNHDMHNGGADTLYGKSAGLAPIEKAPFYAAPDYQANLGSLGGLRIDVNAQVLDWSNKPIARLFAGGSCTGGWMGRWYPSSGTALMGTVHWGRKAGKNAAALKPWTAA